MHAPSNDQRTKMSVQETQEKKKRNKPLLIALIGTGALVATVGGVFAANSITINNGGPIEFGQGITDTNTCDASLNTQLTQTYSTTNSQFEVASVEVSNIDDSACSGKTLHVSFIGTSGVVCGVDGTSQYAVVVNDTHFTINLDPGCDASTVSKVAITTS